MFEQEFLEKLDLPIYGVRLPQISISKENYSRCGVDANVSNAEFLKSLCRQGYREKVDSGKIDKERAKEYADRVNEELDLFEELGFTDYILLVWDVINFCKEQKIPYGPGRGSVNGSLVAYLSGITKIDSIKYDLYFPRFVSRARAKSQWIDNVQYLDGSLAPDIDLDICHNRRHEVVEHLQNKYPNRFCKLSTVMTLSTRVLMKECGKIISGYSDDEMTTLSKHIPSLFGKVHSIDKAYAESSKFKEFADANEEIIEVGHKLHGLIKHKGTHASAYLVSYYPLDDFMPREVSNDHEIISAYDMNYAQEESIKLDLLGLDAVTLTDAVAKRAGVDLDEVNIDDDTKIYDNLQNITCPYGLFQLSGDAIVRIIKKIKPKNINDVAAISAIGRPGAFQFVDDYVDGVAAPFENKALKEILASTNGVCIAKGEKVYSATKGKPIPIEDIVKGEKILSINNDGRVEEDEVEAVTNNGVRSVYKLKTTCGSSISATEDHKILTEFGWKEVRELKEGDYIASIFKIQPSNNNYDENKVKFLGFILGDGVISSGTNIDFYNKNTDILETFEKVALSSFQDIKVSKRAQQRGVRRLTLSPINRLDGGYHSGNSALSWLRDLGLKKERGDCCSEEKFIPDFVFELKEDLLSSFVCSLWDCDGGLSRGGEFYYKTISRRLVYDLQVILLKLGVQSSICSSPYKNNIRPNQTAYQLSIKNNTFAYKNIFVNCIKDYKRDNYQNSIKSINKGIFKESLKDNGIRPSEVVRLTKFPRDGFGEPRKETDRVSIEIVDSVKKYGDFSSLDSIKNTRWIRIKDINQSGTSEVYDLSISKNHNFLCNNIFVHNCLFQENLMAIANKVFGLSLEDGEQIRRVCSKKKKEEVDKWKPILKEKAVELKLEEGLLEWYWDILEASASYSFNKSMSGNTLVTTKSGYKKISEISKGEKVKALNTKNKKFHYVEVKDRMEHDAELFSFEMENGSTIECSMDHKFLCKDLKMRPIKEILTSNLEIITD